MGRKQFLQNLSGIHSGDDSEGDRPSSVLPTGRPLRLAPLSPASPAPGCADGGGDRTAGKRLTRANSHEAVTPTCSPRPPAPGSPSGRKRQLARPPRRASTGAQIMAVDAPPPPSPLAGGGTPVNDDEEVDLRTPTATPPRPRPPSRSNGSEGRSRISSRSNSAADHRISTAQHADSAAWQEITEVLQKLDPEGEAPLLCELYGNFDIISGRFSRISQRYAAPHTPCNAI